MHTPTLDTSRELLLQVMLPVPRTHPRLVLPPEGAGVAALGGLLPRALPKGKSSRMWLADMWKACRAENWHMVSVIGLYDEKNNKNKKRSSSLKSRAVSTLKNGFKENFCFGFV